MVAIQLDFFKSPEQCEMDFLHDEIAKLRKSNDAVRKGTYARLNTLAQQYVDLSMRVDIVEGNICKGTTK